VESSLHNSGSQASLLRGGGEDHALYIDHAHRSALCGKPASISAGAVQRRPATAASAAKFTSARDRWQQNGSPSLLKGDYRALWAAATKDVPKSVAKPRR
jgi:hypothetical protein